MKHIRLRCLALWLAFAPVVHAQMQVEFAPFYGCRFGGEVLDPDTDEQFSIKAGQAYGLFFDFGPQDAEMKIELLWSHQDTSLDLDELTYGVERVNLTIDQFQVGGIVETEWGGDRRLREYVSAAVGATHYSVEDSSSDTKFSLSLGLGGKYFLTRNIALRADLRVYWTVVESEGAFYYNDGVTVLVFSGSSFLQGEATIGVTIAF